MTLLRFPLLVLFLLCSASNLARAAEEILAFDADIEVLPDGVLEVTETVRVRAQGAQIKRGIYRDLKKYRLHPEGKYATPYGVVAAYRDGTRENYRVEHRGSVMRIYLGKADRHLLPGVHEYKLIYRTDYQVKGFETHDELYWDVTGNNWSFPIRRASATVSLPDSISADDVDLKAFRGQAGSRELAKTAKDNDGSFEFEAGRSLSSGEGLTIVLAWPKGHVTLTEPVVIKVAEPEPYWSYVWALGGLLLTLLYYLLVWWHVGRDPQKGIIIPRYQAPANVSPAATLYIKKMGFRMRAFVSALVSLAVKGYIEIQDDDDKVVVRKRVPAADAPPLSRGERSLHQGMFRKADEFTFRSSNYNEISVLISTLEGKLSFEYNYKLFRTNASHMMIAALLSVCTFMGALSAAKYSGTYSWGTLLLLVTLLPLLLHGLFAWLLRQRSLRGRKVMDEIEGLALYLETAEKETYKNQGAPELTRDVFERLLPYAYALGLDSQWCDAFETRLQAMSGQGGGYNPNWYVGNHAFSGGQLASSISSIGSSISSNSLPQSSSSGSGMGGGGFSGGGGGGGGGGGW